MSWLWCKELASSSIYRYSGIFTTMNIGMLLRNYRMILILKCLLFMVWWVLLLLQPKRYYTGWTLWVVDTEKPNPLALQGDLSSYPMPRALVQKTWWQIIIHVPWTLDSGYIVQYLQQPLSPISAPLPMDPYLDSCHTRVRISDSALSSARCQLAGVTRYEYPVAFILLAFIL